jgi:phage terminase large subunit-like protein
MSMTIEQEHELVHRVLEELRKGPDFLEYLEEEHPGLFAALPGIVRRVRASEKVYQEWRGGQARPDQLLPGTPGSFSDRVDWRIWLIMGGRGGGKSRSAAEALRELLVLTDWVEGPPMCALVSTSLDAVRIDMVEGQLEAVLGDEIRNYNRSTVEIWLKNGAYLKGYSSERPRRLRGPNFHLAWADEPASWDDSHKGPSEDSTWSNLEFATRMDDGGRWSPRIIATTTPKPVRLLRIKNTSDDGYPGIVDDDLTVISNVRTMENIDNLAEIFKKRVVGRYEGTRLGAQELEGRLLDSSEHALWTPEQISSLRLPAARMLDPRVRGLTVIGVDPSAGDGSGDECGIVVASKLLDADGWSTDQAAVIDDRSMRGRPSEWAKAVDQAFYDWNADYVVVELNQGHEMVYEVLTRQNPNLPIKRVYAKRGKEVRAEPIALLTDQGKVFFGGNFLLLEDQLCSFEPDQGMASPDRMDAFVYALMYLLPAREVRSNLVATKTSGTLPVRV